MMATTSARVEAWRPVGIQINAAMDTNKGWDRAFLADHARQVTAVGVSLLRSLPEDADIELAQAVGALWEQVAAHTHFLSGVAQLDPAQAGRLMAASRAGYRRFASAFRDVMAADYGQTKGQIISRIESALAD